MLARPLPHSAVSSFSFRSTTALALVLAAATASAQTTTRASVGPAGLEADGGSFRSAISDDGNIIVFESKAMNFASGDTGNTVDLFVRDVAADTLDCISLSTAGKPGSGDSFDPRISGDGRYVAFVSDSPQLVGSDTNATYDVFWFDRQTKTLQRVSVDSAGAEGLYGGYETRISKDGQVVMFTSGSPNLVANDNNGFNDVFVHDVQTGATERVSVSATGTEGSQSSFSGAFTDDGRYALFASYANDLDPSDGNPGGDVFLKDRQTGALTLVSLDSNGNAANDSCFYSTISGDGNVVAFVSYADNLVAGDTDLNDDLFVRDLRTGVTTVASVDSDGNLGFGVCYYPILSEDGRYVAFTSLSDLVPNPSRFTQNTVFVRDLELGWTMTPAEGSSGNLSKGESQSIAMSRDGRFCSFSDDKADVVAGDTNKRQDVFVHETGITAAASVNFGAGLAGTLGVPALTSTLPQIHRDCTLTIGNSLGATTFALLFLGDASGTVPTNLGASILLLPSLLVPLSIPAGGLAFVEPIPADEFLIGVPVALQVLELDAGAIHDVSFTPRLDLTLGR